MQTQTEQMPMISVADLHAVRDFLAGQRDELPRMGAPRSNSHADAHPPVVSRGIPRARHRSTQAIAS